MKNTTIAIATTLALVLAASGSMAALGTLPVESDPITVNTSSQTGENSGCLDYLILWAVLPKSPIGDSERIDDVTGGANWTATSDEGSVWVDFYDELGNWVEGAADSGSVPSSADHAYGCVVLTGSWPDVPIPGATFTYEEA